MTAECYLSLNIHKNKTDLRPASSEDTQPQSAEEAIVVSAVKKSHDGVKKYVCVHALTCI